MIFPLARAEPGIVFLQPAQQGVDNTAVAALSNLAVCMVKGSGPDSNCSIFKLPFPSGLNREGKWHKLSRRVR
jgi:hypothetical protein